MSEAISKRNLSQIQPVQTKRQEVEAVKKTSKPGRKPVNSEPKNKRTAQNRAAQRAFRERKEKKMKELEDKVTELENERKAATTEADFLRIQVEMLSNELTKYKGKGFNIESLKLDRNLSENYQKHKSPSNAAVISPSDSNSTNSPVNLNSNQTFEFPWGNLKMNYPVPKVTPSYSESSISLKGENSLSPDSEIASSLDSPSDRASNIDNPVKSIKSEPYNFDNNFDEKVFCNSLNMACGTKDKPVPTFPTKSDPHQQTDKPAISPFSVPASTPSQFTNGQTDFLSFFNNHDMTYDPEVAFNFSDSTKLLDDLEFLKDPATNAGYRDPDSNNENNNNFELFDGVTNVNSTDGSNLDDFDPINALTTDELSYDPFEISNLTSAESDNNNNNNNNNNNAARNPLYNINSMPSPFNGIATSMSQSAANSSMSKYINSAGNSPTSFFNSGVTPVSSLGTPGIKVKQEEMDDFDDNAVVPAKEEKMIKCTEIWDRVTSHPKYGELDIDGLCSELRTKAKCSDKGVLVNVDDFEKIFSKKNGS